MDLKKPWKSVEYQPKNPKIDCQVNTQDDVVERFPTRNFKSPAEYGSKKYEAAGKGKDKTMERSFARDGEQQRYEPYPSQPAKVKFRKGQKQ